jgi:hypothetical protein
VIDQLKDWILNQLCLFVAKHKPERLNSLIKSEVERLSSEVAIRASMEYLNREGILHCAFCPQRMGLQRARLQPEDGKAREVYLCMKHYSQSGAAKTGSTVRV